MLAGDHRTGESQRSTQGVGFWSKGQISNIPQIFTPLFPKRGRLITHTTPTRARRPNPSVTTAAAAATQMHLNGPTRSGRVMIGRRGGGNVSAATRGGLHTAARHAQDCVPPCRGQGCDSRCVELSGRVGCRREDQDVMENLCPRLLCVEMDPVSTRISIFTKDDLER